MEGGFSGEFGIDVEGSSSSGEFEMEEEGFFRENLKSRRMVVFREVLNRSGGWFFRKLWNGSGG